MVHGSWEPGRGAGAAAPFPPARLAWAMSHEPLTIKNRIINELFDYKYY